MPLGANRQIAFINIQNRLWLWDNRSNRWTSIAKESQIMKNRIIVAISGASGAIYGIKMLQYLQDTDIETHLIISEAGKFNISVETEHRPEAVLALADHVYDNRDMGAPPASGSYMTSGMLVVPCSIKSLSGIANCYSENLIARAADVTLKEKRKLVLMVRETPLHQGHLQLMLTACQNGAHILPPAPAFYHHPKTIDDIINQTIGKIFDIMGFEHDLFQRWG
jgi:4-hydroxy-3-polyprenylbenzoate decarboxylase